MKLSGRNRLSHKSKFILIYIDTAFVMCFNKQIISKPRVASWPKIYRKSTFFITRISELKWQDFNAKSRSIFVIA